MDNNFSRSNVNERTLSFSQPDRSSFDRGCLVDVSPMLGRFTPFIFTKTMPGDTLSGSLNVSLALEKVGTPSVGKIRVDTHTFHVSLQRINRDYRKMMSKMSHAKVTSFPSFNPIETAMRFILCVITGSAESDEDLSMPLQDYVILSNQDLKDRYLDGLVRVYGNSNFRYGYTQDWFVAEEARVSSYSVKGKTLMQVLAFLMEPLCGAGSICDYLGYPILTPYSHVVATRDTGDKNLFTEPLINVLFSPGLRGGTWISPNVPVFDVSPLLASYACYYDYLRDYHVEPSGTQDLLDPDDFASYNPIGYDAQGDPLSREQFISHFAQIMIPKYRYWSRDALTTIQPDDAYRHVYTPIANDADGILKVPDTTAAHAIDQAVSILLDGSGVENNVPWFGNKLFRSSAASQNLATFKQDLQTMRRTGMLEKWLMRNYYMPDSFSGYIESHYGVSPANKSILSATYLGGNESFLNGSQLTASVSTDETPVGTRTLTGGFQSNDSFSLNTTEVGFVISFVSLVPIRKYDAANMHLKELTTADLPLPEFATDARCEITGGDLVRGLSTDLVAGYVPRYYQYRTRLDSAHGKFLTDYRHYDWLGDAYNMATIFDGNRRDGFVLNPYTLRIHPNMDAFIGLTESDPVAYGEVDVQLAVNSPLPAAIEFM